VTTGTPVSMLIENTDQRSKDYSDIAKRYRPGHADFTYDRQIRRARLSRRRALLGARDRGARGRRRGWRKAGRSGRDVRAALVQMGEHKINRDNWDWDRWSTTTRSSAPTRKPPRSGKTISTASARRLFVGAVIEVVAENVPAGLGAPIYAKLDQDIAANLMSINAVKGVEIGNGFEAARISGEENADEIRMGADGKPDIPVQQCRRHSRRHFDRAAGCGPLRGQAHLFDPDDRRSITPTAMNTVDVHQGPARPLRGHSRRAHRRGHGGLRIADHYLRDRGQTGRLD
jgi:chorismate synthase